MTSYLKHSLLMQLAQILPVELYNENEIHALIEKGKSLPFTQNNRIEVPESNFPPYLIAQGSLNVVFEDDINTPTGIILDAGDLITPALCEYQIKALVVSSKTTELIVFPQECAEHPILQRLRQRTYQQLGLALNGEQQALKAHGTIASSYLIGETKTEEALLEAQETVNMPLLKYSVVDYAKLLYGQGMFSSQMVMIALLVQLFMLAQPIFYMTIFNHVFGHQNLNTLNVMAIGMVLILLLDMGCKYSRGFLMAHQLEWLDKYSLNTVAQTVLNLPALTQAKLANSGQANTLVVDIVRVNQVIASTLLIGSLDGVFTLALLGILFLLHPIMASVAVSAIIPISLLTLWVAPNLQKNSIGLMKGQQHLQMMLNESLQQAEGLQGANATNRIKTALTAASNKLFSSHIAPRLYKVQGFPIQGFFTSLAGILTLYLGAHLVLEGKMSYGVYMAINMLSRTVMGTVQSLLQSVVQFRESTDKLNELAALTQQSSQEHSLLVKTSHRYFYPEDIYGNLGLQNVSFTYAGSHNKVLDRLNLTIRAGEKVVITGANGVGKTTLVRLLAGIMTPTDGQVIIDGMPLNDIAPETLTQHIGMVSHRPALFSGTLKDNLLISQPDALMHQVTQAISTVGLDEFISKATDGLDTKILPFGANLSAGIAARIALARLIIHRPQVLLLDESINTIEPNAARQLIKTLFEGFASRTIAVVTADPVLHQLADRIIVLHNGQVVEDGNYNTLIGLNGHYARQYGNKLKPTNGLAAKK